MLAREAVISLPIPQAAHLERFEAVERLSEPFVIEVDVICEEAEVDFLTYLGEGALITVAQEGLPQRIFSGLIYEAEFQEEIEAGYRYHLILRPWFYALSRNLEFFIFQQKSVVDILQAVFEKRGCRDVDFTKLQKTYQPRDYCVQYRESDFAFLSRLMEDEGIYYFFDHRDGRHTMVLCDGKASHPLSAYTELPYLAAKQTVLDDRVWRWTETVSTGAEGKATFRDFDFTVPTNQLQGEYTLPPDTFVGSTTTPEDDIRISTSEPAPAGSAATPDKSEIYDFPTGFTQTEVGNGQAETAMQAYEAERRSYRGVGDTVTLACGYLLTLAKHPLKRLNQQYLVVGQTYRMDAQAYVSGGDGTSGEQPLVVEVMATPAEVQWRAPRLTPRPVARGPETAFVVGPSGETIYTDEWGRVKVRFHWDRSDPSPDQTCWMRVAYASADNGFGHVVLPRIGQEVVIDFLNGNPDLPLVVGSVYNGDKKPAYAWADEKTKSVWRSHTIDGGSDDYNEISFEDKTSEELFNVQAQKDRTTLVKHDDTTTIKHDATTTVTGNLSMTVQQGDETRQVTQGKRTTTIMMNDELTVSSGNLKIGVSQGSMTTDVSQGDYSLNTDSGQVTVEAATSITLKVGGSSIVIDQSSITLKAITITIQGMSSVSTSAASVSIEGSGTTTIKGGIVMIN